MLISAVYSFSGISSYFSCSETPKLEQITALNFSGLSKLARWKRMRDKVLLHSVTCNRDESIMLQRNKSEA